MKVKRPLVIPALIFGLVSLTAVFIDVKIALIIAVITVFICGLVAVFYKREMWVCCLLCILLTVSVAINYNLINRVYLASNESLQICAEVTDIENTETGVNNVMRITSGELYGCKIKIFSSNACFGVGDAVNISVKPYIDETSSNLSEKIFASGKLLNINSVNASPLGSFLEKMRNGAEQKMFSYMSNEGASVFSALLVGNRDYLPAEFEASVKNAGLSHVLVVSGMHMAVLIGGLLIILKKSKLPKWVASLIGILSVLLFMAVCGFTPSVMRAGIMYLIIIFSGIILRKNDAVSSLLAAVIIITLINPFIFGSVSFLLSASATAGVLVLYPIVSEKFSIKNKLLSRAWQAVLVSASAVVCTAPITLIFFGTVNIMAVITSVIVSLAVTGALIIGALAVLSSFMPGIEIVSQFLFFIADLLLKFFIEIVKFFG